MKQSVFIFFVLFALTSTNKVESSIVEKIQCLITNEVIYEYVVDIIEIVKTKDVPKIIEALLEAYPVIEEEVLKCWNKELLLLSPMRDLAAKGEKPAKKKFVPEKRKPTECESNCYGSCMHIKKHFEYAKCADDCIKEKCKQ